MRQRIFSFLGQKSQYTRNIFYRNKIMNKHNAKTPKIISYLHICRVSLFLYFLFARCLLQIQNAINEQQLRTETYWHVIDFYCETHNNDIMCIYINTVIPIPSTYCNFIIQMNLKSFWPTLSEECTKHKQIVLI